MAGSFWSKALLRSRVANRYMLSRPARVFKKLRRLGQGHLCELTRVPTANIEAQQVGDVHHLDGRELVVNNAQVFGGRLAASRYELN